jgi:hypothetical protein
METAHGPIEVLDVEVAMAVILEDEKCPASMWSERAKRL